jgi:hypothetical protein
MRALILDSRAEVLNGYRLMLPDWGITEAELGEAVGLIRTRNYDLICLGEGMPVLADCPSCLRRPAWLLHSESYKIALPQVRALGVARAMFRVWPRAWEDPALPTEIPCLTGQRVAQR